MEIDNREIAVELSSQLGVRIFSCEYDIVALLHRYTYLSYKDIVFELKFSPSTVHRKIRSLTARGVLLSSPGEVDARRTIYQLSESARVFLEKELKFLATWRTTNASGDDVISNFLCNIENRFGISVFESHYNIILSAYCQSGVGAGLLIKSSRLSRRNFYYRFRELKHRGIIKSIHQEDLGERQTIHLSNQAMDLLDLAHQKLSEWASKLPR